MTTLVLLAGGVLVLMFFFTAFVVLAAGVLVLVFFFADRDKPTELAPDVWVADDEERALNLKLKTEAWRAGRPYFGPGALAKIEEDCAAAQSKPFAPHDFKAASPEPSPKRLVRRHPMRPASWV
jgi:hypothetical protein